MRECHPTLRWHIFREIKCSLPLVGVVAATAVLSGCSSSDHAVSKPSPSDVVPRSVLPKNRLIVLDRSIGAVSLSEPRATVRRTLGAGRRSGHDVSFFGGRLVVSYWAHDAPTNRVNYMETAWDGFHTRSGVRVGTSLRELHLPRGSCSGRICVLTAGHGADARGTGVGIRGSRVAWIAVGHR